MFCDMNCCIYNVNWHVSDVNWHVSDVNWQVSDMNWQVSDMNIQVKTGRKGTETNSEEEEKIATCKTAAELAVKKWVPFTSLIKAYFIRFFKILNVYEALLVKYLYNTSICGEYLQIWTNNINMSPLP